MEGSTLITDYIQSKFGSSKTDTVPHLSIIGGKTAESYFSHCDNTSTQLISTTNTADNLPEFKQYNLSEWRSSCQI